MVRKILIVAVVALAMWPMRATLQPPAPGNAAPNPAFMWN
jgi:hypothetical protein